MRNLSAHDLSSESNEHLVVRRPASEPVPSGGEVLAVHLAERLSRAEHDLRAARRAAALAEEYAELLGRVARHIVEHAADPVADLLRIALPALGDWCLAEEVRGDTIVRTAVAVDLLAEERLHPWQGVHGSEASIAYERLLTSGRVERLALLPDLPQLGSRGSGVLEVLGQGPVLMAPVYAHGKMRGALVFGRVDADYPPYGEAEQRLVTELAGLVALSMEQHRAALALQAAERSRSEFLSIMSHELRTPLNAIAGYAQLLEMGFRGPLNEAQHEAVSRILRGQEHLLELVDAVLTFSRLTSGRLAMEVGEISARTLLSLASEPLARQFVLRDMALEISPCTDAVRVLADHERAPQILRHLLANALKFTPSGGRVTISCAADERFARFVVSDTGCGIPAAHMETIFHPFVQVERGRTRSADGCGLGLAIGRELAIRMGGTLTVRSEPGAGSEFTLTLPRAAVVGHAAG